MKVALLSYGTRGDVAPLAYLASELRHRGHAVTMLAPPDQVDFARSLGIDVRPVGVPAAGEAERRWYATDDDDARRAVLDRLSAQRETTHDAVLDASLEADAIISGFYLEAAGSCIAEATGATLTLIHFAPYRTVPGDFNDLDLAMPAPGRRADGALVRRLERVMFRFSRGDVADLRTRLALPATRLPTSRRADALCALELQAYSPALVPGLREWSPRRPLVGSLTPSPDDVRALGEHLPEPGLEEWLAAGTPPLFVGFGSMPLLTSERASLFLAAARRLGLRVLFLRSWSDPLSGLEAADVFVAERAVQLSEVLPRCAAAVHHGGSGTTGTVAALGLPQLVCSILGDQPFWGDQVVRAGVGAHLAADELDVATVTECLAHLLTREVADRARTTAGQIAGEPDPTSFAADLVENMAQDREAPARLRQLT